MSKYRSSKIKSRKRLCRHLRLYRYTPPKDKVVVEEDISSANVCDKKSADVTENDSLSIPSTSNAFPVNDLHGESFSNSSFYTNKQKN